MFLQYKASQTLGSFTAIGVMIGVAMIEKLV
jgi:hypothetical protein